MMQNAAKIGYTDFGVTSVLTKNVACLSPLAKEKWRTIARFDYQPTLGEGDLSNYYQLYEHAGCYLRPVYMIPPRRDGTFSSRLDGKLA